MRKSTTLSLFLVLITLSLTAQHAHKGMYFQWGYNTEVYTKSNIHFRMHNGDNFTLHKARAHDKPDLDAISKEPLEISIPQYNYRIGFYLDASHNRAVEINFDHIKYVVTDGQTVRVTGVIDGQLVDGDSVLNPATFLHLEHTDGGNLLHINYVQFKTIGRSRDGKRDIFRLVGKAGAGINIPRTDFTFRGNRLNNYFHVAGYNASFEGGIRYHFSRHFFLEGTVKTGYVHYINALANTTLQKGNRVSHGFGYGEGIGLIGYQF